MQDTDHSVGRRPVLKTAGTTLGALGGLASPVAAAKGGKQQLEDTESLVEFTIYPGQGTMFPGFHGSFESLGLPPGSFPVIGAASTDPPWNQLFGFDTRLPEVTPNGNVIHYILRFVQGAFYVNKPKPYILKHEGDNRYVSKGAVVNFEVPEGDTNLLGGLLPPGKYRAAVRDEVQLYDTGYFDWSATRTDFYRRGKGGINYVLSLLYVIWDEDGDDNEQSLDRGDPYSDPDTGDPAVIPPFTIPTADELIQNGPLNPGGQ